MSVRNSNTMCTTNNYRRVQNQLYSTNIPSPGQPPLPPEPPPPPPPPPLPTSLLVQKFKESMTFVESYLGNILHIKDKRRGRDDPTLEEAMVSKTQFLVNYVKLRQAELWEIDQICDSLLEKLTETQPFSSMSRVLHWVLIHISQYAYETYKKEEFISTIQRIFKTVDKVYLRTARFLKIDQEPYLIEELVAMLSRLPLSDNTFLSPEVPQLFRKGREFLWPYICSKSRFQHTYFLEGSERVNSTYDYIQFRRVWNLMRKWKGGVLQEKRQEYYTDIRLGAKLLFPYVGTHAQNLMKIDKMVQFLEPCKSQSSLESKLHPLENFKWRDPHSPNLKSREWATYYIVLLWTVSRAMVQVKSHSEEDCRFALRRVRKLLALGIEAIQQCGATGKEIWKIGLDIFGTSKDPKRCKCEKLCDKIKTAFPNDFPASVSAQRELRHGDWEVFFVPHLVTRKLVERRPNRISQKTEASHSYAPVERGPPLAMDFRSASQKAAEEAKKFAAGFQHLAQLALMDVDESRQVEAAEELEPEVVEVSVKRRKGKEKKRYLAKVDTGGRKDAVDENEKSENPKKDDIMVMPPLPPLTLTEILDCGKSKKKRREYEQGIKAGNADAGNDDNEPQGEDFSGNLWPVFCPRVNSSENGKDHGRIHSKSRKGTKSKNKGNHSIPLEDATEEDYVIVAMKNPFCKSDFIDLEILSKKQGLRKDLKIVYFLPKSKESSKWFRRYRRKWRRGGCRCDVYKECDSLLSSESYQFLLTGEHSPAIDDTNPME